MDSPSRDTAFPLPRSVLLLAAAILLIPTATRAATEIPDPDKDVVAYGKYMAEAADCMPCHTVPGGPAFAGGRPIDTPFGTIYSPNITPDRKTGIGDWSKDMFYDAVHSGLNDRGAYLYPAMPYTSYTLMTRRDVDAIYAYLQTVAPVEQADRANEMSFPFNVRAGLLVWRELYFQEGAFTPDPSLSAQLNRGAYLVRGPGHCGECHTPRTLLGGLVSDDALGGAAIDGWLAPDISGGLDGVKDWSDKQLKDFLRGASDSGKGVAFGPMAEVVHDSLSKLADSDLDAIVAYLKNSTPREPAPETAAGPEPAKGAHLYLDHCAQCHQAKGAGIPNQVPALAGNAAVQAAEPNDIVQAVLFGLRGPHGDALMPGFAQQLDGRQVAAVSNYVRTAWGNRGTPNTTEDLVAALRSHDGPSLPAAGRESAVAFGCPAVDASSTGGGVTPPDPAMIDRLAEAPSDQWPAIVREAATPMGWNAGTDPAVILNSLLAAYCPSLAGDAGLSDAQRHDQLNRFRAVAVRVLFGALAGADRKILVRVPLPQGVLDRIDDKARAAKKTREAWIEETLEGAVK